MPNACRRAPEGIRRVAAAADEPNRLRDLVKALPADTFTAQMKTVEELSRAKPSAASTKSAKGKAKNDE